VTIENGVPMYMRNAEYQSIANDPIAMSIYPHVAIPHAGAGTGTGVPAPQQTLLTGPYTPGQQFAVSSLQAQLIADWALSEAQKMAAGAQRKLEDDVARIEAANAAIRELNERALLALKKTVDRSSGSDRKTWVAWWKTQRRGYETKPESGTREKPTYTVAVSLPYIPTSGPLMLAPIDINGKRFCVITNTFPNIEGKTHGVLFSASCFGEGTLVHTVNGLRPIERLRKGDLVLGADLTTGLVAAQPILSVHQAPSVPTVRLRIGSADITATDSHPFYRPVLGWTKAGDLRSPDRVQSRRGQVVVTGIAPGDVRPVYNLRVDGGHTFFVGHVGLLVHDANPLCQ
jgi:hypothetical protein